MIDVHVTRAQHAMSIHMKADIQSERRLSKGIRTAMRFPAADRQRNQPKQKN
jgi:hypothetical protein